MNQKLSSNLFCFSDFSFQPVLKVRDPASAEKEEIILFPEFSESDSNCSPGHS